MQGYENNLEAETVPVIEKEMKDKKRYFQKICQSLFERLIKGKRVVFNRASDKS